ncbi:hypothetical protein BS78_05G098400 [Paspalum vaginatum]|nr:hypothetical protein BS78_05G098400 [Paspalum vaginatum]KAJ1274949.1 hypothetical protein BS78_05G098400 [Paspalum vaginatum]
MAGRKKQQGSSDASKESGGKGKEKEVREDGEEPVTVRARRKCRGEKENEARDSPAKEKKRKARGEGRESPATAQGKEMVVLEEAGKDKEEETAAAAKTVVGPQFFKVFFPIQSGERLKIPQEFNQHLRDQRSGSVSLKGPSGNKWQVVLTSGSAGFCFEQGWKEFATDHSLQPGDFLVFTYDGCSRFSVTTFCALGVVSPQALAAKPHSGLVVVKVEDDEGIQVDMDAGDSDTSEAAVLPPEEGNGITGKRARGVDGTLADGNASKRHSSVARKAEKRPEAISRNSKDASTIVNSKKDAMFSLLDESTTGNKTQVREKNVPRLGKFITKRNRQPVVISQRRPITQEEKDLALRRAMEFKSKNPFSVQTMMESYVYVGFFMNIPCDFVRESLPQTNKKMTLWDPLGKSWEVNYVYYSDRSVGSFSGGWGKFALGNNLEKYDVCVFELFKEDNIKVHIYRVVPEITPLLRASNKG